MHVPQSIASVQILTTKLCELGKAVRTGAVWLCRQLMHCLGGGLRVEEQLTFVVSLEVSSAMSKFQMMAFTVSK